MIKPETQKHGETREQFERRCPVQCPYCPERYPDTRAYSIHLIIRHPG